MELSVEEIEALARVSRIALTPQETEQLQKELSGMIRFASRLTEIEVEMPIADARMHTCSGESVPIYREDVAVRGMDRETVLQNARNTQGDRISVPRAVEA